MLHYKHYMRLLHLGCDRCLPLEILALTKMSLMYLSFLNVTIMGMHSCADASTRSNPGAGQLITGGKFNRVAH